MKKKKRRITLPKEVRILGTKYSIFFDDYGEGFSREWKIPNPLAGIIDYGRGVILLSRKIETLQDLQAVLLHEIIHGVLESMGERTINEQEDVVTRVSNGIYAVIKDNPKVVRFLTE